MSSSPVTGNTPLVWLVPAKAHTQQINLYIGLVYLTPSLLKMEKLLLPSIMSLIRAE